MPKPIIWVVDTSILLNILRHPTRNQDKEAVNAAFRTRLKAGHLFVIPITTIIETGNWAYKMEAGLRKPWAEHFARFISQSLSGRAPFLLLDFPSHEEMTTYLAELPTQIDTMGLGDKLILSQWEQLCESGKYSGYQINIWSLDNDALKGRECNH